VLALSRMRYAGDDARAQAAVLLAVGRAVERNAALLAYACEVVAGRASESRTAADLMERARPALNKRLGALPAAEYAMSAREFLTTAWRSSRALALAPLRVPGRNNCGPGDRRGTPPRTSTIPQMISLAGTDTKRTLFSYNM
jgi:hypothetical protein